ncbi:signal peptidase II [Compostimonas suwonensis]|uniref:Lipoprotein signal peptidase n=1 Tax=Compostimonas suwonensis TaxID=1048394 RepID=A0A2M9BAW1_9MICO|nr:signal peptidase II [Compostimonas suwonensis]PJJ55084.1 signal peptidase II [Compostimonas suwonensis]
MAAKTATKVSVVSLVVLAVVAVGVFVTDQVAKYLVVENLTLGEQVNVLGEALQLRFVKNPGAAFGLGSGMTWIFSIAAIAVMVLIIWFARRIRSIGWAILFGLLLGGILGNLTDRLTREPGFGVGHVVDFIYTPWMLPAIYNCADIAIVSSMGLFIILTIRGVGLDGTRVARSKGTDAAPEAAQNTAAPSPTDSPVAPGDSPR